MKNPLPILMASLLLATATHGEMASDQDPLSAAPAPAVEPAAVGSPTSMDSRRYYALALLQTARLHLARGELNQGKSFLARAFNIDPKLDTLESRALDMMHPDFPQIDMPETGYRYGPVRFSDDGRHLVYLDREETMHFDAERGKAVSLGPHGVTYGLLSG